MADTTGTPTKGNTASNAAAMDTTSSNKRQKTKQGASADTQESRYGSVGGVDTGGTGTLSFQENVDVSNVHQWHFKKIWRFYSHALSRTIINSGTGLTQRVDMSTGMCAIPIEYPFFYCSKAEWADLPPETYLESCHQELRCHNARTSFQANSSQVATATQNNQLWLNFMKGAERSHPIRVVIPTVSDSAPAHVTGMNNVSTADISNFCDRMWGTGAIPSGATYPPGICGTYQEWPMYASINLLTTTPGSPDTKWYGFPNVDKMYDTMLAVPNYNTTIAHNSYTPKKLLVTEQRQTFAHKVSTATFTKLIFRNERNANAHPDGGFYVYNNGVINEGTATAYGLKPITGRAPYLDPLYDPTQTGFDGMKCEPSPKPPIWMYFGLQDIPAININAGSVEYQEGQIFWELECTMKLFSIHKTVHTQTFTKPLSKTIYEAENDSVGYSLDKRCNGMIFGGEYNIGTG